MATFQATNLTFCPLPSSSHSRSNIRKQPVHLEIKSVLQFPDLAKSALSSSSSTTRRLPKSRFVLEEIKEFIPTRRLQDDINGNITTSKMYAILEAVSDRIEMHANIKEQRDNWNTLLLNSTNMITLTATLASVVASAVDVGAGAKISSVILFSAATAMLTLMNKIQPSQLVEEQRNAVRLFKQLQTRIQTQMDLNGSDPIRESDVADAMEKVLAIDRAYPLPLLGAMLDKFPKSFEPAHWWPSRPNKGVKRHVSGNVNNGWSEEMESEMREIVRVVKGKDLEDYERLGGKALKLSKALAIAGPMLMGMAAVGAALISQPWGGVVAGVCGALGSFVSSVEHGGQVGMVVEMYRNCAGLFKQMEEDVEMAILDDNKVDNGQVFELKMALRLGRSLSELRDIAARSASGSVDGFANKLY